MIELLRNILTKRVACSSRRDTPTAPVVWIRPEEVTDWSFVWHLHDSIKLLDLVERVDRWRETSMKTEDITFNNSGEWKIIKERGEILPDVGVTILSKALVVESIDLSDLLTLVIASQDGDTIGVSDLASDKECDGLNRVVSTIDIVTHEKVVGVWQLTTNLEEFFKIIELTMDITADGNWCSDWLHVALLDEDLLGFLTEGLDTILWKRAALEQFLNLRVEELNIIKVHFSYYFLS